MIGGRFSTGSQLLPIGELNPPGQSPVFHWRRQISAKSAYWMGSSGGEGRLARAAAEERPSSSWNQYPTTKSISNNAVVQDSVT